MSRQSSIRNQRTKGLKVKHGVQVFVLVMLFIWLVHQAKHPHAKSKAMIGEDAIVSSSNLGDLETLRLGRKDLIGIGNDVRILQDEKDEAEEEEPEIFKEADEEDGRVMGGDPIDINDVLEEDDMDDMDDIVEADEDAKKELGETDISGGEEKESEPLEKSAQINSLEAQEDEYKEDDDYPSEDVVQNPKIMDVRTEWAVVGNLDEEKMGENNNTGSIGKDINFNITREHAEHEESEEIHRSDDASVDPGVLRDDGKAEAEYPASLAALAVHESNLTTKAPSGSNPPELAVDEGEAGKNGERLEEKLLLLLPRNESRVFGERD